MSPVRQNPGSRARLVKIGVMILVMCVGAWGCARKPASRAGDAVLEGKVAKLEQDLRTTSHARDKARKDLAALEIEAARLQQEANEKAVLAQEKVALLEQIKASQAERDAMHKLLVARTADRDDLRQQVTQRIAERDTLTSRVDRIRKGMRELLAQDENPATTSPGTTGGPSTPAASNINSTLGGNS